MANYTILLIDYEPRSIERFRQPLMSAGYGVEVATDGVAGLQAFDRLKPDMVLVEAMIPKKHGFEVCQEIKRSPNGRRTPVLITTGVYKGRKYRTQALHIYGCDEYIEKPIAAEQLLAIVGRFLGGGSGAGLSVAAPGPETDAEAGGAGEPFPAPASSSERTPPARRGGEPPPAPGRGGPVARAATKPVAVVRDLTEDEIMARLDAILPTSEASILSAPPAPERAHEPRAAVAEAEPFAEIEGDPLDVDPFQQMQAELNAELGSLSAALDRAPAPILEPEPEAPPIPSDQSPAPSLLESLARELEEMEPKADDPAPATLPEPEAEDSSSAGRTEEPAKPSVGRIVNFDAKRGRKTRKSATPQEAAAREPGPVHDAPRDPVASTSSPQEMAGREFMIPAGSLVASTLEGETTQRRVPIWVWAAAAAALLAGVYFVFLRGAAPGPAAESAPPPVENAIAAGGTTPSSTPSVSDALEAPAEPPAAAPESRSSSPAPSGPVAPPALEPRHGTEARAADGEGASKSRLAEPPQVRERETASSKASAAEPGRVERKPAPAATAPQAPAPIESAPAAPTTVLGGVAAGGVAAILPPPPDTRSGPSVAAGALVSIDEVDAPPVSLTRKVPLYSMQARQMRIQGTVVLKVLVDETGAVADVQVVTPVAGADVTESAVKAARQWTYRPATKDGVPVKVWKIESVGFKL